MLRDALVTTRSCPRADAGTERPMTPAISIDGDRLWQSLMEMAEIGATRNGGCCRLALTDLDRQARDLLVSWCKTAGCRIETDQMGNIFATRPGGPGTDPVMTGSHLDTQPTGGRFDGVYGVLAGLEVIRTLNDRNMETAHPIQLVVWTNEEGSRFQPAMMGSGVVAHALDIDRMYASMDSDGHTFRSELARIGYLGSRPATTPRAKAYIETHIEQGPVLEQAGKTVGIVTHQQGIRWYDIHVTGSEAHAGTTPMPLRQDALAAAAEIILELKSIALDHSPSACATVGRIECYPGSPNTIPGTVRFSVDLRHPQEQILDEMENRLSGFCSSLPAGCSSDIDGYWRYPARHFDDSCIETVRNAAERLGYSHLEMPTGAGHDASYMAQVVPTSMIFIPCRNGISHNEQEFASQDHCTAGCNVLLHSLLAMAGTEALK